MQATVSLLLHESAIIHDDALIGDEVSVGAYAIIEKDVKIGYKCHIDPHALIAEGSTLGANCKVFKGAVLGTIPQDLKFGGEKSVLEVGDRTVIREYCTLNRGTENGEYRTVVGNDCLLMAYVHVAHDCRLGDQVILSNAVNMGGHVEIDDWVIIGGMSAIHQFVKIGKHAFIGGMARITKDVPPFVLTAGEPLKYYGLNSVGLKRRGFTDENISYIKRAYKFIYRSKLNLHQAVDAIRSEMELNDDIITILDFINSSDRGIIG